MSFFSNYIIQLTKIFKYRVIFNPFVYKNPMNRSLFILLKISIFSVSILIITAVWADPSAKLGQKPMQAQELTTKIDKTQEDTVCAKQVNPLLNKNQQVLNVTGMVCAFCVQGIEIHLKKLSSVKEVNVDLEQGKVLLSVKPSNSPSSAELCEAIKRAGYTVTTIEYAP